MHTLDQGEPKVNAGVTTKGTQGGPSAYHTLSNREVQALLCEGATIQAVRVLPAYLSFNGHGRVYAGDANVRGRGRFDQGILDDGRGWLMDHGWMTPAIFPVGSRGERRGWTFPKVKRPDRGRVEDRSASKVFSSDMLQAFFLSGGDLEGLALLSALLVHRNLDTGYCFPSDEQIINVSLLPDSEAIEAATACLVDIGWLDPDPLVNGTPEWLTPEGLPVTWRCFSLPLIETDPRHAQTRLNGAGVQVLSAPPQTPPIKRLNEALKENSLNPPIKRLKGVWGDSAPEEPLNPPITRPKADTGPRPVDGFLEDARKLMGLYGKVMKGTVVHLSPRPIGKKLSHLADLEPRYSIEALCDRLTEDANRLGARGIPYSDTPPLHEWLDKLTEEVQHRGDEQTVSAQAQTVGAMVQALGQRWGPDRAGPPAETVPAPVTEAADDPFFRAETVDKAVQAIASTANLAGQNAVTWRDALIRGVKAEDPVLAQVLTHCELRREQNGPVLIHPMSDTARTLLSGRLTKGHGVLSRIVTEQCGAGVTWQVEGEAIEPVPEPEPVADTGEAIEALSQEATGPDEGSAEVSEGRAPEGWRQLDLAGEPTPASYQERRAAEATARHERTRELVLCGARPLSVIAQEEGYYDLAHLCHDFKKREGCSPTQYRNRGTPEVDL